MCGRQVGRDDDRAAQTFLLVCRCHTSFLDDDADDGNDLVAPTLPTYIHPTQASDDVVIIQRKEWTRFSNLKRRYVDGQLLF